MQLNTALYLAAIATQAVAVPCGLLGPAFPAPTNLAKDKAIAPVLKNITDSLSAAIKNGTALYTNLIANETSYSIGVFDTNSTIYSFQHTADEIALGKDSVKKVDGSPRMICLSRCRC